MVKYFICFLLILPLAINSFFYGRPSRFSRNFMNLKYKFAREYYDFYLKFKEKNNFLLKGDSYQVDYKQFARKNNDSYYIFEKNYKEIKRQNEILKNNNLSLELGINQFMDTEEFIFLNNEIIPPDHSPINYKKIIKDPINYITNLLDSNSSFSWNNTDLLSDVKNQLSCGSCWAFSTTTSLETFMRVNNFTIDRLSEQELVDCSTENSGCNGGLMHLAMDYIIKNKGLSSHEDYPYDPENSDHCKLNVTRVEGSNMTDYLLTIPESINDLKYSVKKNPVAIALDADTIFFKFYKRGIIDIPIENSKNLNHAVLLVGYDYDEHGMYWIIQNSWGKSWGDNGFCKIRVKPKEGTLLCQLYGVYPSN